MRTRTCALALTAIISAFYLKSHAQWTPVCNTGDGFVVAFAEFRDTLFSSGFYSNICATPAAYASRYNGAAMESAGTGLPDAGHALRVIDGDLYSVGYQRRDDSNRIYRWNGRDFETFGPALHLSGAVTGSSRTANLYDIIKYNGRLVLCGEFDNVAGMPISGITMRNASGDWDSLGAGLTGSILAGPPVLYPHQMCVYGADLIVGGAFMYAGGKLANGIARWDGSQWYPMADGFDGPVYALAVFNGELYAGGQFSKSGSLTLGNLAKWNGASWTSPNLGLRYAGISARPFVHSLLPAGNRLIVAGGFDRAIFGNTTYRSNSILSFNGTSIDTLHGGIPNTEIEALALYRGKLFAGGGSGSTSSYIGSYEIPAGIGTQARVPDLSVVPDAHGGQIRVACEAAIERAILRDMTGRVVCVRTPASNTCSLPLPNPGVYTVTVLSRAGMQLRKIVVN